jgi:protein-tyrosine phosphatase
VTATPSILFVCLGNICRSPLAEGALRAATRAVGLDWHIDSAGTGNWHVGSPPDNRAVATAHTMGVDISGLRARQVEVADFARFTHIFALDAQNLADLRRIAPGATSAELSLLLDAVPGRAGQAVADPYYGDDDGFVETWRDVSTAAQALIDKLRWSTS